MFLFHIWFDSFAYGSSHLHSGVKLFVNMFLILLSSAVASCTQVFIVYTWVFSPKVAVLWHRGEDTERTSMQIQVNQSVLQPQRVKNQSFSVEFWWTMSNQGSQLWNLTVTERAERLVIPPVYSLTGIHAFDRLQKLLQLKSGKSFRRLQYHAKG